MKRVVVFLFLFVSSFFLFNNKVIAHSDDKYIEFNYQSQIFTDLFSDELKSKAEIIRNFYERYCEENNLYYIFTIQLDKSNLIGYNVILFEKKEGYGTYVRVRDGYSSGFMLGNSKGSFSYKKLFGYNLSTDNIADENLNFNVNNTAFKTQPLGLTSDAMFVGISTTSATKYVSYLPFSMYEYHTGFNFLTFATWGEFLYSKNIELPMLNKTDSYYAPIKINGTIQDSFKSYLDVNPVVPTISFSLVDSEKIIKHDVEYYVSKTFKISFSSIDNNKYYYEYSSDNFENDIETIMLTQSNSFDKKFTKNQNFSVRIRDRNTNNIVAITTLTISGINYYTYEETIDTTNLSKIEIDFDIPHDKNFLFYFDFLLTYHNDSLSIPYLEVNNDFDVGNTNRITDFVDRWGCTEGCQEYDNFVYSADYGVDYLAGINSAKLVIDVQGFKGSEIYLKFSSAYNFTFNYIYKQDVQDYFKTIDMSNNYGLYLIPKTGLNDNYSSIYLNGIYDIEARKNYQGEDVYVKTQEFNYSKSVFQNLSGMLEDNNMLYFINKQYGNTSSGSSITFDTRYYNYAIKQYPYSEVEIENPNTGNTDVLAPNDTIENKDTVTVGSIMDQLKGFLNDLKGASEQFNNIFDIFFNSLPTVIQLLLIFLYSIFLIFFIFSMGGWKS